MFDTFRGLSSLLIVVSISLVAISVANAADDTHLMNVEYAGLDENGFAKNPIWTFQRVHANDDPPLPSPLSLCGQFAVANPDDPSHPSMGAPPCTDQPYTIDYPFGGHDFLCGNFGGNQGSLHGHVDWLPAQYSGTAYWGALRHWYQLGDGDFNFGLVPDNRAGLTIDNFRAVEGGRNALGLEFDSAEVASHWGSSWWQSLRHASNSDRHSMVDGDRAIVWGYLGLDTEHYAHSELHPVYAIAIEDHNSTQDDDVWRFFVRNWGNEGFCSQFQHNLDNNAQMQIFLPRPGAQQGVLAKFDVKSAPQNLQWSFASVRDGAVLTFDLGRAADRHMFDGELHIRWVPQSQNPGTNLMILSPLDLGSTIHMKELLLREESSPESTSAKPVNPDDAAEGFWNSLSANQKQKAESELTFDQPFNAGPARQERPKQKRSPLHAFGYLLSEPPRQLATVSTVVDQQKIDRDHTRAKLVCEFENEKKEWPLISESQCKTVLQAQ